MSIALKRLKGGSLAEVMVALVIISLSIALSGTFMGNLFDSSNRMLKLKAWYAVNIWRNEILLSGDIEATEIDASGYRLVKTSALVNDEKGLWLIQIVAVKDSSFKEDQLITESQFYLEKEPEDSNENED